MTRILNFGSLNLDYSYEVDHFVKPGETLSAKKRSLNIGGKGLNQSIALAKAGVDVYHAGAIGKLDGAILKDALNTYGVNTDNVYVLEDVPSGNAFIQVDPNGENCIVLYGGANRSITKEMVDETLSHFEQGDWLMLQNEINMMDYIIKQAHEKGMTICLNASPIDSTLFTLPLDCIDYFFVNQEEGKALADSPTLMPQHLMVKYPHAGFIMTLGAHGSMYFDQNESREQAAYEAEVVDTTAAGDTFTGFCIGAMMEGKSMQDALKIGAKASSIAISKKGAATSIPTKEMIHEKEYVEIPD